MKLKAFCVLNTLLKVLDKEEKIYILLYGLQCVFICFLSFNEKDLKKYKEGVGITREKFKNHYLDSFTKLLLSIYKILGVVLQG